MMRDRLRAGEHKGQPFAGEDDNSLGERRVALRREAYPFLLSPFLHLCTITYAYLDGQTWSQMVAV